jgi:hypothetical protein
MHQPQRFGRKQSAFRHCRRLQMSNHEARHVGYGVRQRAGRREIVTELKLARHEGTFLSHRATRQPLGLLGR